MFLYMHGSRNDSVILQFLLVVDLLQVPRTNLLSGDTTFTAPQQNITEDQSPSIALPPSVFINLTRPMIGVFFTHYATAVFFPLAEGTREDIVIGTSVIGASVANVTVRNLEDNITVVFQLRNTVSAFLCMCMCIVISRK